MTAAAAGRDVSTDLVTCTIDGVEVHVPKGTLVIRAAERVGIQIPRFCDHPLLAPAGACRQCLVEVATPGPDGSMRAMPKPQASCTLEVTPGMVVATQQTSGVADAAQRGVMEFLLINHPLDCPVCDKGGECPLQNQAVSNGRATSRFIDVKRTFPKPIKISTEVLLDRERCILCQRCTRFSKEIAGDPFIDLQMRGIRQQIGVFDEGVLGFGPAPLPEEDLVGPGGEPGAAAGLLAGPHGEAALDTSGRPFASYFSGNTIQICPVGALTSAAYRFRSRPFDLVSSPSVAEHDACGSAIRVDHRRGVVMRRLAGDDPAVNEEWITDKDRFAFAWQSAPDRLTVPLVRDEVTHELVPTSWSEALEIAAQGLRNAGAVGVLPGGRLTLEDAYAWSKFARVALHTNDIDFRARSCSAEEAAFLAARVAGTPVDVTYADLEQAPRVLLVGLEPEEEAGTVFLRLRKGVLAGRVRVTTVAPFATDGTRKLEAELVAAAPGTEAEVLDSIRPRKGSRTGDRVADQLADLADALAQPGAVVLAGERLAGVRGGLSAVERLVTRTGARLAWIPRRAGDRGALDVGALPGLLPGGRPVSDHAARGEIEAAWGVRALPDSEGRDLPAILAAARAGRLGALVVGGVDVEDLPDPGAAEEALERVGFVVQLEVRSSSVTHHADVVLPVAPPVEKAGTFVSWDGRRRPFEAAIASRAMSDARVLDALGEAMGTSLGLRSLEVARAELDRLARRGGGARGPVPTVAAAPPAVPGPRQAVLATWKLMLDSGRGQEGEPHLAGTARRPVVRLSAATAAGIGASEGEPVTVTGPAGWITLPAAVTPMPDHVVWLPQHSPGSWVNRGLGVAAGAVVTLSVPTPEVVR